MYQQRGGQPPRYPRGDGSRGRGGRPFQPGRGRGGGGFSSQSQAPPGNAVRTNCFVITKLPQREYYQYTAITPEVKDFSRRQEIIRKLQNSVAPEVFDTLAIYDGRNLLWVPSLLELSGGTYQIFDVCIIQGKKPVEGARGTFKVEITKTQASPLRPGNAIQLLNQRDPSSQAQLVQAINLIQHMIKQMPNEGNPNNAKAYFTKEHDIRFVENTGLELWRGYFQSVRPTVGKMLINVDTTIAPMYKSGALVDVARDFLKTPNARGLNLSRTDPQFKALEKFLMNVKIHVQTTGDRIRTIRALEPEAGRFKFEDREGETLDIATYMKRVYGIELRFKEAVGVWLSPKNAERPVIVPIEMCRIIPGQLYKRKLSEELTAASVDFAKLPPTQRLEMISDHRGPLSTYTTSEYVVQSGMVIDPQPIAVSGRLLPAPHVFFRQPVNVGNGAWNALGQQVNNPAPLTLWAGVSFVERIGEQMLGMILKELAGCCDALGIQRTATPPLLLQGHGNNPEAALEEIYRSAQGNKGLLIVVILPQAAAALRSRVKYWGDIRRGVRTQCLRQQKVTNERGRNQYFNNVALKLNARLGGINFAAKSAVMDKFRAAPSMILGADVGHPAPGMQRPSITSLVWSTDMTATKYSSTVRIQEPRLEHIKDLKEMTGTAIQDFVNVNHGTHPRHIILFRDGLSEGEFETVARKEIEDIEAVWKEKKIPNPPKLTYVVVGKRHHVAFFPEGQSAMSDGKSHNCKAGFVVDQDLANPYSMADFYLQSHGALLGTSRSSHYILIKDDNNLPAKDLQELAFSLCHVYAKATRSVSIPAPVYYADLVCQRMAFHLPHDSDINFSDSASVASGGGGFNLEAWKREFGAVNDNVKRSMYFL